MWPRADRSQRTFLAHHAFVRRRAPRRDRVQDQQLLQLGRLRRSGHAPGRAVIVRDSKDDDGATSLIHPATSGSRSSAGVKAAEFDPGLSGCDGRDVRAACGPAVVRTVTQVPSGPESAGTITVCGSPTKRCPHAICSTTVRRRDGGTARRHPGRLCRVRARDGGAARAAAGGGRRHAGVRRARRPGQLRPGLRPGRRDVPAGPADVRHPDHLQAGHLRAGAGAGHRVDAERRLHPVDLQAPRGRDVPRRHAVQRRGGLLQLRPLVQPARARRPRPRRYYYGDVFEGFAKNETEAGLRAGLQVLRRTGPDHRGDLAEQGQGRVPGRVRADLAVDLQPGGAAAVRRGQGRAERRGVHLRRLRHRPPDRHRAVQVRELRPHRQRDHAGPQRRRTGARRPRSTS